MPIIETNNALKTGSVDVGYVDLTAVPEIPSIERAGYHVFGTPAFGSNIPPPIPKMITPFSRYRPVIV